MKKNPASVVAHPGGDDFTTQVVIKQQDECEIEQQKRRRYKKIGLLAALGVSCVVAAVVAISQVTGNKTDVTSGTENGESVSTLSFGQKQGHIGCFQDGRDRQMEHFAAGLDNKKLTVNVCILECYRLRYIFAGLQYGRECFCSNENRGAPLEASKCNMPCVGDNSVSCGGFFANDVYRIQDSSYKGCWKDGWVQLAGQRRRVLEHRVRLDEAATTVDICKAECAKLKYRYSGLQFGKECWCGNQFDKVGMAPEEECNMKCSGNDAESCGGFLRNNVFENSDVQFSPVDIGFASGVTGGGNVPADYPKTIWELKYLLEDDNPRVIILDKEFNFIGSEGSVTEEGCRPGHHQQCVGRGQDSLVRGVSCTGEGEERVQVTYDKAGVSGLKVKSDKTIRGVGTKGVIVGKGLRIMGRNVIVQNIHITNLNPHIIWGGDGIQIWGDKVNGQEVSSDLVWIDHVKFSLIGRQMVVTGFGGAGRTTLSYNEFDGRTQWSSSCDNKHYWTILMYGADTRVTMLGNVIHHTSGRGPKVGGDGKSQVVLHAVNNYWYENSGHDFDVSTGAQILAEGNLFENSRQPRTSSTKGNLFAPTDATKASCRDSIGRECVTNLLVQSGDLSTSQAEASTVLDAFKQTVKYAIQPVQASSTKQLLSSASESRRRLGGKVSTNFGTTEL